jgi:hypothetical protein
MMDHLKLQETAAAGNAANPIADGMLMVLQDTSSMLESTGHRYARSKSHRRMPPVLFGEDSFYFMHETKHRRLSPVFDDSSFLLIIQLLITSSQVEPELFNLLNRRKTRNKQVVNTTPPCKQFWMKKPSHSILYSKHCS